MAKKWSQKTEKASLVSEDEFLIIDSEDAAPATKNKRVKVKNAAPYKKYAALLNQTGTNAPVATVLENTIGNIVWTRSEAGVFIGTLNNAFTADKTFLLIQPTDRVNFGNAPGTAIFVNGTDEIIVQTINFTDNPGGGREGIDNFLMNTSIEIRVYL